MRGRQGILSRIQRRWAWAGFLLLVVDGPIVAMISDDDSWMMSLTVASLVAFVILIDDVERRRPAKVDRTPEID
jgi:hypothetical protein